jgi:hypothetical protein
MAPIAKAADGGACQKQRAAGPHPCTCATSAGGKEHWVRGTASGATRSPRPQPPSIPLSLWLYTYNGKDKKPGTEPRRVLWPEDLRKDRVAWGRGTAEPGREFEESSQLGH